MPDKSTAATLNSVIGFLHFLHELINDVFCKVETSDDPADLAILFYGVRSTRCNVSFSLLPQLTHLFDGVRQKFVVVQSHSFLGF